MIRRLLITLMLAVAPALLHAPTAAGRDRLLQPTGRAADYDTVRAALAALQPGDTLTLGAGLWDWSGNVHDSTVVARQPGGLAVPVSNVTIRGRAGTVLRGALDRHHEPVRPEQGTNSAFRNAPGVHGVRIEDLVLDGFENGVVLVQGDSLSFVQPADAFREGSRGWTLARLTVKNGPFGVTANGRHVDLSIVDCRFELLLPRTRDKDHAGSFAVSVRPMPPLYPGIPARPTLERNVVIGPQTPGDEQMYGALIVSSHGGRLAGNQIERFGIGILMEGDSLEVRDNTLQDCGIGIVAWSPGRQGLSTKRCLITGNRIEKMRGQRGGLMSAYSGTGILLAGARDSQIRDNTLLANTGSDIIFGTVRTTPVSSNNTVTGNGGKVLMSTEALRRNQVTGSTIITRKVTPPKPKAPPAPTPAAPDSGAAPGHGPGR